LYLLAYSGKDGSQIRMFKQVARSVSIYLKQETAADRWERMLAGAISGFIAASAYALTISTINVITLPGMHLGVDWSRLLFFWVGLGLVLVSEGIFVGWFTEDHEGIVFGGLLTILVLFIVNLVSSTIRKDPLLAAQSVITTIAFIGAIFLVAFGLRLAINRYLHIRQVEIPKRRYELVGRLGLIVFLVGMTPGGLARYDRSIVNLVHALNDVMSNVAADPALESRLPLENIPALKPHLGTNYTLFPRPSSASVGAYDFTVRFQDGFAFTCFVSTDNVQQIRYFDFSTCNEGTTLSLP